MLESFSGKKVLITGGLGFIGSNLAMRLLEYGAEITLVDSLIPEYGGNLINVSNVSDRLDINISDVRDVYSLRYLVKGKDYLFNLAGQTSHQDSMDQPFTDLDINCKAQLSILETCREYNPGIRIVFASTRQIYGKPDYLPVDERHLIRPVDVNGVNKAAGEQYHILYNNVYDIPCTVLRLTNTYGPRMRIKDARQTFVGIWIRQLFEGVPIKVFGDGKQLRDFNYVDDVVRALIMAASSSKTIGKAYNLGSNEVVSLEELAKILVDLMSDRRYELVSFPEERKKIDIGDYYADYSLFSSDVGWVPEVSLKQGLCRTLEFYQQHLEEYC